MTAGQRAVLAAFVREAVARDLDDLHGEIARLKREILLLERLAGLPAAPLAVRDRRERVAELRSAGHSERSIAAALRVSRAVIQHDLAVEKVPSPPLIRGIDGRATRGPRPAAGTR
jgi:DNA-binding NarL/FixJ family response regulator